MQEAIEGEHQMAGDGMTAGRQRNRAGNGGATAGGLRIERVLPTLDPLLERLDVGVRGRAPADFPTRDLPEPSEIRPVIGRLRVRSDVPDAARDRVRGELETWTSALRQRLDAAPYRVGPAAVML